VNGSIAQRDDHLGLGKDRFASGLLERRLMDQSRDVVLVGEFESAVEFVSPGDRQFESATSVEAGGTRISDRRLFGFGGRLVQVFPFGRQKLKVAHGFHSALILFSSSAN
jgi:hypothetical protein